MVNKRLVALTAVILLLAVALLGPAPGLGMGTVDNTSDHEFLLVLNAQGFTPPSGASPGVASYLRYLHQRELQRDLVPFLMQLQDQELISHYELLDPPNAVLVRTSKTRDRLAAVMPGGLSLMDASSTDRATAAQAFQAAGPRSITPLADPSYIMVRETENQVEGSVGVNAAMPVTVTVQSGTGTTLFVMNTTSDAATGHFIATANDNQDIAPGNTVLVVSESGSLNRSVAVPSSPALTAKADIASSTIAGDKPAGADLEIILHQYSTQGYFTEHTGATPGTTYSVQYTSPTVTRADDASVYYKYPNGDGVAVYTHPDFARIYYHTYTPSTTDKVMGFTTPWAQVDITVTDKDGNLKGQKTTWGNKIGEYWWEATDDGGVDIQPYDLVSVSNLPMKIEAVGASASANFPNDTVTASFSTWLGRTQVGNAFVRMEIDKPQPNIPPSQQGYTGSDGTITLDFTPTTYSIQEGDTAVGYFNDQNNNQTAAIFQLHAPAPTPVPTSPPVPTATPRPTSTPEAGKIYKIFLPDIDANTTY